MVIPIERQGNSSSSQVRERSRSDLSPLSLRRCGAWVAEVGLIALSGLIPFSLGALAQHYLTDRAAVNPLVRTTTDAIAQTLALPPSRRNLQVTGATNILWTVAIFAPIAVGSWQLYKLSKTGQTLPKSWFGIKVVTVEGVPSLTKILVREGVGRWGIPLGFAVTVWRYGGVYPDFSSLVILSGLMLMLDGAIALFSPRRRTFHDRLAQTQVVLASKVYPTPAIGFPPAPPRWLSPSPPIPPSPPPPLPPSQKLQRFWAMLLQYSIPAWLMVTFATLMGFWGSYVGVQVYSQIQANRRAAEQRKNDLFIALVKQLSTTSTATTVERQAAILAFGATKDDPRAIKFLADLLSEEKQRPAIAAIQQVLVRMGNDALPELQRLNQALSQDLASERYAFNPLEYQLTKQRLVATQEAIANILSLDTTPLNHLDLSNTNLDQSTDRQATFNLVLDNKDISGINFEGSSLTGASFANSRFWSAGNDKFLGTFDDWVANLNGVELREANLSNAVLNHVSLENATLIHANLNQADLSRAILSNADLSSAKLVGANLQQSFLENASLPGADLTEANLSGANLTGARLVQVSAVGTQLSEANLTASDWRDADLSGANLNRANLQNANFSNTRLSGTNFNQAKLQNVSFRNANLSLADLQGANITGADFKGAIFTPAKPIALNQFIKTQPDISLSARVKGVDFTGAKNLDNTQIAYICANGGRHPRCR